MRDFNLESISFLVESSSYPKVKAGESSDSNLLNRFFKSVSQDISQLATRTSLLASYSNRLQNLAATQAGSIQAILSSLSTRVDTLVTSSLLFADMHSLTYIDVPNTTATVNKTFGQATLPILEQVDLLVQEDAYGNKYVSDNIKISYAINTGSEPSATDFREEPSARDMLKDERAWVVTNNTTSLQKIWVRLDFPFDFLGRQPNVLEFWPVPCFALNIEEVAYNSFGSSLTGDWTALDLSYLPGYSPSLYSNTFINNAGPIRLHLPTDVQVSSVRFKMTVRSGTSWWGLFKLKLYHFEYDDTANLVVKNPYGFSISEIYLKGKNPSELSALSKSIITNTATITLTSNDPSKTPVVTGVVVDSV
jgi:hypothetical protein